MVGFFQKIVKQNSNGAGTYTVQIEKVPFNALCKCSVRIMMLETWEKNSSNRLSFYQTVIGKYL